MIQPEIIAAILATTPVPPLPQMVLRGEDSRPSLSSSHDTIASSLIAVMQHKSAVDHKVRLMKQVATLAQYREVFCGMRADAGGGSKIPGREIYETLCAYTRSMVANFDLQGLGDKALSNMDMRFENYDSVSSCKAGERLFDTTYEHLSAVLTVVRNEAKEQQDADTDTVRSDRTLDVQDFVLPPATDMCYDDMLRVYIQYAWM
jgi:hypothetical protein